MGVFKRPDSKVWWLYLKPTGQRERTAIMVGETSAQRRDSRALALELYHTRMLGLARATHALPEPTPAAAPRPTFDTFADWYDAHHLSHHAGAEREREILPRLRAAFGALPIDQITKAAVITWRTARRHTGVTVERFGLASGSPAVWRQVHATLTQRGSLTLAEIRALHPDGTRNVCGTLGSRTAAPYFRRVGRGRWAAVGHPPAARQQYPPPSAATVNREVDFLQQILRAAVDAGHVEQSPLYGLANLEVVQPIRRTMSEAEERAILHVLAPDDRAILLIGLDTLARMIDILDLEWADVHDRTVDIRDPKNGQSYSVPLSTRVRAALADVRLALGRDRGRYCFPRRRQGTSQAARRKAVADSLKRACIAVGLPYGRAVRGLTFHWSTRRTGATRMIQRGGEKAIAVVQRIGNWKDPSVLIGIYQETLTAEMEAAVESVSALGPAPAGGVGQVLPWPKAQ